MLPFLSETHVTILKIGIVYDKIKNLEEMEALAISFLPEDKKHLSKASFLSSLEEEIVINAWLQAFKEAGPRLEDAPLLVRKIDILRAENITEEESFVSLIKKVGINKIIPLEKLRELIVFKQAKSRIIIKISDDRQEEVFSSLPLEEAIKIL